MAEQNGRGGVVRVAAVGDVHCTKTSRGALRPLFASAAEAADVLVLCGDLTDYGLPEEAEVLIEELKAAGKLPTIAVLGNHDFESGKQAEVRAMLVAAGVTMLDGESCELHGIGFAGAKGFGGGFGPGDARGLGRAGGQAASLCRRRSTRAWLAKLESALARLRTEHKIAVLHYAPIRATVENEPPEIFAFLGCSRLEEPLAPLPGDGRRPRPRPQRHVRREDADRGAGLQRLGATPEEDVPRPAALLDHRGRDGVSPRGRRPGEVGRGEPSGLMMGRVCSFQRVISGNPPPLVRV